MSRSIPASGASSSSIRTIPRTNRRSPRAKARRWTPPRHGVSLWAISAFSPRAAAHVCGMPDPITPEPDAKAENGSRAARAGPQAQTQAVRLARKTQSLDILYEIATSLSQPGSLEQLLDGFLDTFIELVDARAASVRLATADSHTRLIASRGLAPEVVESEDRKSTRLN